MTVSFLLDAVLAVLVLLMAVWTIAARTAYAAVIGFVAYGLLLAIIWVRLSAPDVALTEVAVGSGVTGVLLLRAAALAGPGTTSAALPGAFQRWAAALLCLTVAAGLATVVLFPDGPAPTLAPLAVASLATTELGNAVTAVLIAYRAMDTLLETVVLLLALLGVWSLAPDRFWGQAPVLRDPAKADGALTLLGQLLPPLGIVVGVYMFWEGADGPGGAFQGGSILAAMWILVMLAGLQAPPRLDRFWLRLLLLAGPAVFLLVGFAGVFVSGAFLSYPASFTKPLILTVEAALTLSIAVTLGLLVAGPSRETAPTASPPETSQPEASQPRALQS